LWTRALAATLPPDRARALHAAALAAAGPAPPPRVVARHAAAAGDPARAAAALVALGDAAADRHRYAEAERHYSRALDCAPPPAVALRARAGRGRARYRLQRHAAAVADLAAAERAAAERGDERLAVGLLLERATALDWCQDRAGAAALAEAAWPRARALGDPRLVARAQLALGVARHRAERTGEALALLARAADGARACGDAETRAIALLVLAPALVYAGRDGDAEARFAEAIAACERAGDDFHLAAALTNRMVLWMKRGDPDAAAADLGRCMRIARRLGNPQLERGAAINLGELELWRGRFERARRLAEAARALQRQFVDGFASYEDALLLARIACARGEPGAAEHLAWIRARCDLAGAPPSIGVLLALVERADADRAAGRIDAAAWDALDRRAADAELLHERLEVLTTACATAAAVGAIACARRWLAAARALARDSQLWSARLTALASRLSPKETPRA
ncbi:MAG: ATP-binding protein, partial [Deltaproteobacteria bacterium]